MSLTHRLDRSIVIDAPREIVFSFFTDSSRWAQWWGLGSTIDARPGGAMRIRYPNGVEALGEIVDLDPPARMVMTFGFANGQPFGPDGSRLTIHLEPAGTGTRLHLRHDFSDPARRDEFVQGWRYQLSLFANAVADLIHADAAAIVDAWFAVWRDPDSAARTQTLERIAVPGLRFRNRFSALDTRADVDAHIGASQRFMPGFRVDRHGEPRQCQGMVVAEWIATTVSGAPPLSGLNVFELAADGRIETVTGFVIGDTRTDSDGPD